MGTVWFLYMYISRGWNSSVGIATSYGLDGQESNPGGGEIFHTLPDQPLGPPNLLYNGHRSFPGVKLQEHGF